LQIESKPQHFDRISSKDLTLLVSPGEKVGEQNKTFLVHPAGDSKNSRYRE